jgi:small subunit ribosomal protein S11
LSALYEYIDKEMAGSSISKTFGSLIHQSCRRSLPSGLRQPHRSIATTPVLHDSTFVRPGQVAASQHTADLDKILDNEKDNYFTNANMRNTQDDPESIKGTHSLHVYAHRHNTHITFTHTPKESPTRSSTIDTHNVLSQVHVNRESKTLLTLSTGNIGFKKGGRGSYDAAYQLAAYAFKYIQEKGMLAEVAQITVLLRGYGAGREAVTKAILGTEGRSLRGYIRTVVDTTRLKQGGTRGKKPRRL